MSKPMILGVLLLALLFISALYGSALARSSGTPEYTMSAVAAPAAGYEVTWNTVGGGASLAGGSYTAHVTIGQPDAVAQSGGSYAINGGYWSAVQTWFDSFLPLIKK